MVSNRRRGEAGSERDGNPELGERWAAPREGDVSKRADCDVAQRRVWEPHVIKGTAWGKPGDRKGLEYAVCWGKGEGTWSEEECFWRRQQGEAIPDCTGFVSC